MEHQFIGIIWTLEVTILEDNLKVYVQNNMSKKLQNGLFLQII